MPEAKVILQYGSSRPELYLYTPLRAHWTTVNMFMKGLPNTVRNQRRSPCTDVTTDWVARGGTG